ncbi:hypothetical protein HYN59_13255 [Flavobacterium album]|uniref:DUF2911 domain-containing protein n=1 Tax=Flavobacterium album TaxID=2175091 RepID=A0A2S1R063_9FLAO|nr:DUF2911 domain-containing protein [Flavobacterium album]AWH86016.1 hypothetical protein HYN59_13255 [Flavobacterium album]
MKLITKTVMLFIAVLTTTLVTAQDKKPASPPATATGKINGANITINYSSPFVKGRVIWGELVPYGKVWRAGANKPTTFETDKALMVEGKELPAGKYAVYVIPEKESATVIFGKDPTIGFNNYDESKDQIRVTVKTKKSAKMNESLIYTINKDNVTLIWENLDIPVKIK